MAKNPAANEGDARDMGLIPGLGRSPEYKKWLLTPVFLCGKSHGQKSLTGYSPWGHEASDRTKRTDTLYRYVLEHEISLTLYLLTCSPEFSTDYRNQPFVGVFAIMTQCKDHHFPFKVSIHFHT